MKEAKTRNEFLDSVKNREPCFLAVHFPDLFSNLDILANLGLHRELAPNDWSGLRGICPLCASWVPGDTLGMVFAMQQIGKEKVTLTDYGDISHLLDNRCINSNCSSREILLIWQGDRAIKAQLINHLQRIRADAESQARDSLLQAVSRMQEYDVLSFSQDAIFCLERNCTTRHLIVGRRFPNLSVWVSALPGSESAVTRAFFGGYKSYLSRLLYTAGFDEGDVAVAHWVSFVKANNRMINLALLSDKNSLGTPREFCILPAEIP